MTVAERVSARLREWGLQEIDGRPQRTAENGEPYVTLSSGGFKPEGQPFPERCASPEEAIESYLTHFDMYVWNAIESAEGSTLIWRKRPNLEKHQGKYSVYSRLLASEDE